MKKQSFNFLTLIIFTAVPLGLAAIVGLLTGGGTGLYQSIQKPPFAPPSILFPIVWAILYTLMGISLYLIYLSDGTACCYILFFAQLLVNLAWPFIFFTLQAFTASFIVIIILLILVLLMITAFYKISPTAGLLQIPYFIWITFASALTLWIAVRN